MRSCSTSSGGHTGSRALALAVAAIVLAGCGSSPSPDASGKAVRDAIALRSPAFADGQTIPTRYTCSSVGKSPPLAWSGVPAGTKELALVVFDPDAGGGFTHWVIFHLAPNLEGLAPGAVPDGARQAENSAGRDAWAPPCPPPGDAPHRYEFTLYALKAPLDLEDGAGASDAIDAITRDATVRGRLVGRFGR